MTMRSSKIRQPESKEVKRSSINFANYNPRRITEEARKKLKANLKRVGLLGGIVWNETTGNLVSGHQRVSVIDEVNKYDPGTQENDYLLRVEVVHLDEKSEKEQNLFMNNRSVQGEFDDEMLKKMFDGIDYTLAGFDDFDLDLMGIGEAQEIDISALGEWDKDEVIADDVELAAADEVHRSEAENTSLDRSTNFYEDTAENQLARHNEVQKIKDRIANKNDESRDGGMLSYVVVSFPSPQEKERFMEMFGYDVAQKMIEGKEFIDRIEFGVEDE